MHARQRKLWTAGSRKGSAAHSSTIYICEEKEALRAAAKAAGMGADSQAGGPTAWGASAMAGEPTAVTADPWQS